MKDNNCTIQFNCPSNWHGCKYYPRPIKRDKWIMCKHSSGITHMCTNKAAQIEAAKKFIKVNDSE